MVYKKRPVYKPRVYKKRYVKKQYKNGLIPYPKSGVEKKFLDITINGTNFSATGVYQLLNGLTQGTGNSDRIGIKVNIKQISIHMDVVYNNNASGASCRLLLVYDKKNNGSAPVIGNNTNTASILDCASGAAYPWVPLMLDNADRYVVLGEKRFNMNNHIAGTPVNTQIKLFKKFSKGLQTVYNDNGATVTAINSGAIYLIFLSNQGATFPSATGVARIRYTDQ